MEQERERPKIVVNAGVLRCPFCHDEVAPEKSIACRDCLARHHAPCWEEGGRCAACRSTHKLVSLSGVAIAKPVAAPGVETVSNSPSFFFFLQSGVILIDSFLGLAAPAVAAVLGFVALALFTFWAGKRELVTSRGTSVTWVEPIFLTAGFFMGLGALFNPPILLGYGIIVGVVSFVLALLAR
jgi:hypothetical protein